MYETRVLVSCLLLMLGSACKDGPTDEGGSGGDTGDGGECWECVSQAKDAYQCYYSELGEYFPLQTAGGSYVEVCATSASNAKTACEDIADNENPPLYYNNAMDAQLGPCLSLPQFSCTGWDPSAHISYNSNTDTYEVDSDIIDDLIADPTLLIACDDGRFSFDGSHYVLSDLASGDFFDELGLENRDEPLSVNGVDLDGWDGIAEAFFLVLNGETEFTLSVRRGTSTIVVNYEIVP